MGWWFGRKSAPADGRPFVPAWLTTTDEEVGFARSFEGLEVLCTWDGARAVFRSGKWRRGEVRGARLIVEGQQVVGARCDAVDDPGGGDIVDAEARTTIRSILSALRQHGLIGDVESRPPE